MEFVLFDLKNEELHRKLALEVNNKCKKQLKNKKRSENQWNQRSCDFRSDSLALNDRFEELRRVCVSPPPLHVLRGSILIDFRKIPWKTRSSPLPTPIHPQIWPFWYFAKKFRLVRGLQINYALFTKTGRFQGLFGGTMTKFYMFLFAFLWFLRFKWIQRGFADFSCFYKGF